MIREPSAGTGRRVLIVDDDQVVMASIARIVKHQGFEPVTASDWVGALEAIAQDAPDVVLLDLSMPHVDGLALLRFIREQALVIPVIVVSAFIDEESRARLTSLGVSAFIDKPFRMADLCDRIEHVVGARSEAVDDSEGAADAQAPQAFSHHVAPVLPAEPDRSTRIRRRLRQKRRSGMKPRVMFAIVASSMILASLLGILNVYLTH